MYKKNKSNWNVTELLAIFKIAAMSFQKVFAAYLAWQVDYSAVYPISARAVVSSELVQERSRTQYSAGKARPT